MLVPGCLAKNSTDLIGMGLHSAPQKILCVGFFNSIRQGESKCLQKAAGDEELHACQLLTQKYTEPCRKDLKGQLLILIAALHHVPPAVLPCSFSEARATRQNRDVPAGCHSLSRFAV